MFRHARFKKLPFLKKPLMDAFFPSNEISQERKKKKH